MSNQPHPPATPAGWYPEGVNGLRYWDGAAWTEQRAPAGTLRPARRQNRLGDVSLGLSLVAVVGIITSEPWLTIGSVLASTILALMALHHRPDLKRAAAVVALVISSLVILFIAAIFLLTR